MINKIGWINGSWESFEKLKIPISDWVLNFGDGIFETVLILNRKPQLLKAHLDRWKNNATKLGMATPPTQDILQPIIDEGINKSSFLVNGVGSMRLNWSRGSNKSRGISYSNKKDAAQYRFWIELASGEPSFSIIKTTIDCFERRNANSVISQCKTFNYMQSIQARLKAVQKNFDDALLLSTTGEMCCGTTSNIIVQRNGKLLTPRLASGCLPGIMREQAIRKGFCEETTLSPIPSPNDKWILINSLSCHPIHMIDSQPIQLFKDPASFWNSLLTE